MFLEKHREYMNTLAHIESNVKFWDNDQLTLASQMEENLRHELYDAHDRVMTFLETLTLDGDPEIAQIEQEIIENYRSYPGKRPVGKEVLT
jgi:hypothetical protein